MTIDPATAEPSLPGVAYEHYVEAEGEAATVVRTKTVLRSDESNDPLLESVRFDASTLDVDLDGSYSAEHASGLGLARVLLGEQGGEDSIVLEHSLAVSDDERRRSLLVYARDTGDLTSVLMLCERKGGEPEPAAHATMTALLGRWSGDACSRSAAPAAPPRARGGLGFGLGGKGGGKGGDKGGGEVSVGVGTAELSTRRTNVFKAALTYAWDGGSTLLRQLQVVSFSGESLQAIRSSGTVRTTDGPYGEYEIIELAADPHRSVMMLLPAGCHLIAPSRLPRPSEGASDSAFATEFGALIAAGESFGWRGFTAGDDAEEEGSEDDEEVVSADGPAGQFQDSPRLVRIQRLYAGRSAFVSGTTSLLTAE